MIRIRIPLEIIAVFILFLIWFIWMIWHKLSLNKLKKRYDPDGDLSRKGEEGKKNTRRDSGVRRKVIGVSGHGESKRRDSIQERDSNSSNKNSKRIRNPFKPLRRK